LALTGAANTAGGSLSGLPPPPTDFFCFFGFFDCDSFVFSHVKTTELIELVISGNLINALTGREMDTLDPHDPSSDRSHFHLVDANERNGFEFPSDLFWNILFFSLSLEKNDRIGKLFFFVKKFQIF
jgi:hypothetical protein